VAQDGIIGAETAAAAAAAVASQGATTVNNAIANARIDFYRNLVAEKPNLASFLNGWLTRAKSYLS
jgi:lysozyme family protein